LTPEARARVDEITHLIVEKLLLTPTENLKAVGDNDTVGAYSEALTRLFGLADDPPGSTQATPGSGADPSPAPGKVEPFNRNKSRTPR
jgi:hypothetical protein